MAYAEKYNMAFKDALGANWVVSLRMLDYEGDVYTLIGGADPLQIVYDGDENNPYDPIRTCKATVNFYVDTNCGILIDDLQDIDDATIFVDVTSDTGQHASGFVVPDQTSKGLSLQGGEISITTQDFFVMAKGLNAVNGDGNIFFGLINIYSYIQTILAWTVYNSSDIDINLVNPYSLYLGSPPSGTRNTILEQVAVAAEAFNMDGGRPDTIYNVLQKILTSFFSMAYWEGSDINIICPSGVDTSVYKTIYIKGSNNNSDYLIENAESLSTIRGAKEVSAVFGYNNSIGYLANDFFDLWTSGTPNNWTWQVDPNEYAEAGHPDRWSSAIQQVGNGRPEYPYGVSLTAGLVSGYSYYATMISDATKKFYKGTVLSFATDVRYMDTSAWTGTQNTNNKVYVAIYLTGDVSGDTYTYRAGSGVVNPEWVNIGSLLQDRTFVSFDLTSGTSTQSFSIDMLSLPEDGTIKVALYSVGWGDASGAYNEARTTLTYFSAILTEQASAGIAGVTGRKSYLTQAKNYTLKADPVTSYIGFGVNESIGGALYGQNEDGDLVLLAQDVIYRNGETSAYSLLHQMVRSYMAVQRTARKIIDFKVYSNAIKFSDLIKFDAAAGISNVFLQLTRTYDVRTCAQTIRAIEVNPQFLADSYGLSDTSGLPNADMDLYEEYNTTS